MPYPCMHTISKSMHRASLHTKPHFSCIRQSFTFWLHKEYCSLFTHHLHCHPCLFPKVFFIFTLCTQFFSHHFLARKPSWSYLLGGNHFASRLRKQHSKLLVLLHFATISPNNIEITLLSLIPLSSSSNDYHNHNLLFEVNRNVVSGLCQNYFSFPFSLIPVNKEPVKYICRIE